jgi:stearoyl-CoA desaturase (delta-9 desaturase)
VLLTSLILTLIVSAVLIQIAVFSTTIYLHRAITHRSLHLHPAADVAFRFALWMTTGIVTREWVAVHRKHHAFTDEEGDPHSPLLAGFWHVQLGNIFYYVRETQNAETVETYARDIQPDVWDKILFDRHWLGLLIGVVVLCATLGIGWGLLAAFIHAFMYIFVLSSSINGLCHSYGYKNFENTATNQRLLALLTGGEGLHNNHHGHPRSPKFSVRMSEIDPAWPVIKMMTLMGLARPEKVRT